MQFQPVFGKSILLGTGLCSLLSGCVATAPITSDPVINTGSTVIHTIESPPGLPWEDPCLPDWPAACMPDPYWGHGTPLLDCIAWRPRAEEPVEPPPYPRFHPLPTRPMFSPASDSLPVAAGSGSATFGHLP